MMKILANDGIDSVGKSLLETAGFRVDTQHILQDQLASCLNEYDAIIIRSTTKIRKELIDACPNLKLIGRGGVGMDNIDVEYAQSKGLTVVNTPASSSLSVAELVFAHLFTGARFLHDANRKMPIDGAEKFNDLKKAYTKGIELRGKTIGIFGFGRIGRAVAKIALGLEMEVLAHDLYDFNPEVELSFMGASKMKLFVKVATKNELLKNSDFVSIHTPAVDKPEIGATEFSQMKNGVFIVNASRSGAIDENALINALNSGKVAFAGLDVFENEPHPLEALLKHPKVSLTPHIGASTVEAQQRIGIELANLIIDFFKK